jgi:hypothetical protein
MLDPVRQEDISRYSIRFDYAVIQIKKGTEGGGGVAEQKIKLRNSLEQTKKMSWHKIC